MLPDEQQALKDNVASQWPLQIKVSPLGTRGRRRRGRRSRSPTPRKWEKSWSKK